MAVSSINVVGEGRTLWDPLDSLDWDKESYSRDAIFRIKRDLQTMYKDPAPGICVVPNADSLTEIDILITGPFDTPYEGGLFHFFLRFPPNYPFTPPRVKLLTTGGGMVRFNPNIYRNGKICMSILGTWEGEAWSEVQNLRSVVMSIQSLLNERPYHNEPGYENKELNFGDSDSFNRMLVHETLRVAVCDAIHYSTSPPEINAVKKMSFLEFFDYYRDTAKRMAATLDGQPMNDPFGHNKGTFNFCLISRTLQTLYKQLSPPPH